MKKLIAKRRLKRTCEYCGRNFKKGAVYYLERHVCADPDDGYVNAYEFVTCPRCKYRHDRQRERFEAFTEKCSHPDKFIETIYDYIPGECVMEPQFDQCRLCGKIVL
jgi:hypothetical protein